MTNIQAAIGLSQLELAEEILSLKRKIAHTYTETLSHLPLRMHNAVGDVKHSFWMCSILVDNYLNRDELRKYLIAHHIETRPFFAPAHCMPHCATDEKFYVAEKVSAQGINLPSYASLSEDQISHICHIIEQYFLSKM
jgi:perosamine synthetase